MISYRKYVKAQFTLYVWAFFFLVLASATPQIMIKMMMTLMKGKTKDHAEDEVSKVETRTNHYLHFLPESMAKLRYDI